MGGLTGNYFGDRAPVGDSFWDLETTGQTVSFGGKGKTTAQMQDIDTYLSAGWDFLSADDGPSDIWAMPPGGGYPILWWQVDPLPALPAFGGGAGTTEDPYLIADANHLNQIGSNPRLLDRCFRLVQDIDLQGVNLYLIGDIGSPFMGIFDGDGHAILNFVYEANSTSYVGLFPSIGQTGEVKNLSLQNVNVMGLSRVGSLAGRNDGRVSGCQATGAVSGSQTVGGLIGWNRFGTVSDCSASVKTSGGWNIGDLVGWDGAAEPGSGQ